MATYEDRVTYQKKYYLAHREEKLAYQKKHYQALSQARSQAATDEDKLTTYRKKYYFAHREELLANQKKNYQKKQNQTDFKEQRKERNRQYYLKMKQAKLEAEQLKNILLPPPLHLLCDDLPTSPSLFDNNDIIPPPSEFL